MAQVWTTEGLTLTTVGRDHRSFNCVATIFCYADKFTFPCHMFTLGHSFTSIMSEAQEISDFCCRPQSVSVYTRPLVFLPAMNAVRVHPSVQKGRNTNSLQAASCQPRTLSPSLPSGSYNASGPGSWSYPAYISTILFI